MVNEIWMPIPGYEGYYQASNIGRIRSLDRIVMRKDGISSKYYGKIMSLNSKDKDGYLSVSLNKNSIPVRMKIHRVIVTVFIGEIPIKMEVNHKDCNKENNSIENLEIVTSSQNSKHAWDNGRIDRTTRVKGDRHGNSKLKSYQVMEIRKEFEKGEFSYKELGEKYGVTGETISYVVKRKIWNHI